MDKRILGCCLATNFLLMLAQAISLPKVTIEQYYTCLENTTRGTVLFNMTAKYSDGHREMRVSTGDSDRYVKVQHVNGSDGVWNVILNTELDWEIMRAIHLVFVAEGDDTFNIHTQLIVEDVNDNAPTFRNLPYTAGVQEGASVGTTVYTKINAMDPDNGQGGAVSYYMTCVYPQSESARVQGTFVIDLVSGKVTLNGSLDYETANFYHYIVTAMDGGGLSSTADLFITIQDVQDSPPFFTGLPYIAYIDEDAQVNTTILTVVAQDGDRGLNVSNPLTYNISQDLCVGLFQMNSAGTLSVGSKALDRDMSTLKNTNGVCNVIVQATEVNKHPPQMGNVTATATVTITIRDVNNNPPTFSNTSYTATIRENSPPGVPLTLNGSAQITVSDKDRGDNSAIKIFLINMTDTFELEQSSFQDTGSVFIRVKNNSKLNYEESKQLFFEILARDTPINGTALSASATVTVNIEHVNEFAPEFNETDIRASVPEGSPPGYQVFHFQAFDKDLGGSDEKITYSLQNDGGIFDIDSHSGNVTVASNTTDRETTASYILLVQAQDGGGLLNVTSLTISISDVNDNPPVFRRNQYEAILPEGEKNFTRPLRLEATDEDEQGTPNSNITYSLLPSTTPPGLVGHFEINPLTGDLVVKMSLDFDAMSTRGRSSETLTLTVEARDQGTVPLSSTVDVTITLLDKNDNAPNFDKLSYNASIPENSTQGESVIKLTASDNDTSAPNNIIFFVLDSGGFDNFRVNSTSGLVTVGPGAKLDREKEDNFQLSVLVLDRGDPPRSSSATVSVFLLDINDEPPMFGAAQGERKVAENSTVGDTVLVMTATDPDTDHLLTYELLKNETQAFNDRLLHVNNREVWDWFAVNSTTGAVYVNSTCDRETADLIVLSIMVTDIKAQINLPQTAVATVKVTLKDVNDNSPVIQGNPTLTVSEAVTVGTEVATVTATDKDKDQTVIFLVPDNTSHFEVTTSGKISLRRGLNREEQSLVNFTLVATDSGSPPLSSNITVSVTVVDANDNAPVFTNSTTRYSVYENATRGTLVGIMTATDADEGVNGLVSFVFSDIVQDFIINKTTGEITVGGGLDREIKDVYMLSVTAFDNPVSGISLHTSKQIEIRVLDVNDHAPEFHPSNTAIVGKIVETAMKGDKVSDISPEIKVTDQDLGQNSELTYQLTPMGNFSLFTVNETTGSILVNSNLTGMAEVYSYILTVTDGGDPPLNATANVTITVIDVNLNAPQFVNIGPVPAVPECVRSGSSIYTFNATDDDKDKDTNGKVQYFLDNTLTSADDLAFFRLDVDTGDLTLAQGKSFDSETKARFELWIFAKDKGLPFVQTSQSQRVTIIINDTNDNSPKFNESEKQFEVYENLSNVTVGNVLAFDPDIDARTLYRLEVGEFWDYFNVNANSRQEGVLTLLKPLDREKQSEVTVTITATDDTPFSQECGNPPQAQNTSIKVRVLVKDINDNPPIFTSSVVSAGFLATSEYGTEILNLQDLVTDADLEPNRVHAFYPAGPIDPVGHLKQFGLDSSLRLTVNGSLQTNRSFSADMQGLLQWRVLVNDSAGSSETLLKVYVVGTDKIIRISFFHSKDDIRNMKSQILSFMRNTSQFDFIDDGIIDFVDTNGNADRFKSVLLVHAVDKNDNLVDAATMQAEIDHNTNLVQGLNQYQALAIQTAREAEMKSDDKTRMEYILVGIICVLVIGFLVTLIVMIANIYRFKRKLMASTTEADPLMSKSSTFLNMNPITVRNNPVYGKEPTAQTGDNEDNKQYNDLLDDNNVDGEPAPTEFDEEEVMLELYGTETSSPVPPRKGNPLLDEVLQAHALSNGHAQSNESNQASVQLKNETGLRTSKI
ncbi:cadherin-23-like [Pomacea canaliculata]|uniref:cadherin-23-like n=1 Tax=Pomacea canaliculata TaxID=400727 RepID=UPI000D72D93F|nr:cadherin-23-like [Pomacea canaliculata]